MIPIPKKYRIQNCAVQFVVLILGFGCSRSVAEDLSSEPAWELVWEEEFDGTDLTNRWSFDTGCLGWGNGESECYTDDQEVNAVQNNGILSITAKKEIEDYGNGTAKTSITSSRMKSKDAWEYGKFVMKARLPKGKYLWPAFWMMPNASEWGVWPKSGEIDIMEYRGSKPNEICGTIHFGEGPGPGHKLLGSGDIKFPFDFSEDWHEFGFEWNSTKMRWFVDDKLYHEQSLLENIYEGFYMKAGEPFNKPFYIIINLAVGGNFFLDEAPFTINSVSTWTKSTYEIDWIRVSQKKNETQF